MKYLHTFEVSIVTDQEDCAAVEKALLKTVEQFDNGATAAAIQHIDSQEEADDEN